MVARPKDELMLQASAPIWSIGYQRHASEAARPYRVASTPDEALKELLGNSGVLSDPDHCVRGLDEVFGGTADRQQPQVSEPVVSIAASA
jgi:HD-GYP domain-containing protein (c-di-GMP phosphodiesterase class II)